MGQCHHLKLNQQHNGEERELEMWRRGWERKVLRGVRGEGNAAAGATFLSRQQKAAATEKLCCNEDDNFWLPFKTSFPFFHSLAIPFSISLCLSLPLSLTLSLSFAASAAQIEFKCSFGFATVSSSFFSHRFEPTYLTHKYLVLTHRCIVGRSLGNSSRSLCLNWGDAENEQNFQLNLFRKLTLLLFHKLENALVHVEQVARCWKGQKRKPMIGDKWAPSVWWSYCCHYFTNGSVEMEVENGKCEKGKGIWKKNL